MIGQQLQQAVQGGNEYGNLTLTRFFAIHVFILPAALIGLVVVHLALFRRHGVTPRWGRSREELERSTQPFWPDQMFKDMVAMAGVFAVMVAVNVYTHGVKLDGPADPASNFDARPEWYFRPLFQLLKYFEGAMEHIVALGTPVVVGGVLLGLPFVDRKPDRSPRARALYLTILGLGAVAAGILTVASFREDAADPQLQERLVEAKEQADRARALAKENGMPAAGGTAVFTTAPHHRARSLWLGYCAACHQGEEREGPEIGPGYNSRQWIRDFLANPNDARFFGTTQINEMDPVELPKDEMDAIVEFVYAQTGAEDVDRSLADKGQTLFDEGDCSDCHEREGTAPSDPGPNLAHRGTVDSLASFILDAGRAHFFGSRNQMPKFGRNKLSEDDRFLLAEYLVWLRTAPTEESAQQ